MKQANNKKRVKVVLYIVAFVIIVPILVYGMMTAQSTSVKLFLLTAFYFIIWRGIAVLL